MFYMRIQKFDGADYEYSNEFLGNLIKELNTFIKIDPDNYKGHFILKIKGRK